MSGQAHPNATDPDILWRTVVENGRYLCVVDTVHGSTRNSAFLSVFDGTDHAIIHRVPVQARPSGLLGVNEDDVQDWEAEIIKAVVNPDYRRIVTF